MVCTVSFASHSTARPLESFLRYHLAIGFDRVLLFADDASDEKSLAIAGTFPAEQVLLHVAGPELDALHARRCSSFERLASLRDEVSARQMLNAELAMAVASDLGLRWLVHLDADELFFTDEPSIAPHFARLDEDGVHQMTYLNLEGVPEEPDTEDYFSRVTLFRRHHFSVPLTDEARRAMRFWMDRTIDRQYLLMYDNGKSACRVLPGATPLSQHLWRLPAEGGYRSCTALADVRRLDVENYRGCTDTCILHFPVCGLSWLRDKYKTLGAFPDTWLGGKVAVPRSFHTTARQLCAEDCALDGEGGGGLLEELFRREVLLEDAGEAGRQVAAGVCLRITRPAGLLGADVSRHLAPAEVVESGGGASAGVAPMDAGPQGIERGWIISKAIAGYL